LNYFDPGQLAKALDPDFFSSIRPLSQPGPAIVFKLAF